jgi:hypothetical protein
MTDSLSATRLISLGLWEFALRSSLGWHPDGNVQLERHLERGFESGVIKPLTGDWGCVPRSRLRRQTKPKTPFGICYMLDVVVAHDTDSIERAFCPQTDMGIQPLGLQDLSKQYEGL